MADYTWPTQGERPWDAKVKAAVDAVNAEAEGAKSAADAADAKATQAQAEIDGRLGEDQLSATFAVKRATPNLRGMDTFVRGTSWGNGAVATTGAGFADLIHARMCGGTLRNGAAGGSPTAALPAQFWPTATHGWTPGTSDGLVIIEGGIGESLQATPSTMIQSRIVFEDQITLALRWHRATAYRDVNHATVDDGDGTITPVNSSVVAGDFIILPGGGGSFTVTPEEGVQEIALIFASFSTAPSENSDFTVQVGDEESFANTAYNRGDTRPSGSNVNYTLFSHRVVGLDGDTITVTSTGKLWFIGYLVMGNTAPPPILLVPGAPLLTATVPTPASGSVTVTGTPGSGVVEYRVTSHDAQSRESEGSAVLWSTTAPATLDETNYVTVSWAAAPGATGYSVYKNDAGSWHLMAVTTETSWDDQGQPLGDANAADDLTNNHTRVGPWQFLDSEAGGGYAVIYPNPRRSDATVYEFADIMRNIALSGEFNDGTVQYVDYHPSWDPVGCVASDRIHPDNDGHAVIADAGVAALRRIGARA